MPGVIGGVVVTGTAPTHPATHAAPRTSRRRGRAEGQRPATIQRTRGIVVAVVIILLSAVPVYLASRLSGESTGVSARGEPDREAPGGLAVGLTASSQPPHRLPCGVTTTTDRAAPAARCDPGADATTPPPSEAPASIADTAAARAIQIRMRRTPNLLRAPSVPARPDGPEPVDLGHLPS